MKRDFSQFRFYYRSWNDGIMEYWNVEFGNISFTLFKGDWMSYNDASGSYRVINRSSLTHISSCFIIPAKY